MPKATVTSDTYAYHEECNDPSTPRHDAVKGDELNVSEAELKRGVAAGGLKAAGSSKAATEAFKDLDEDQLDAYAANHDVDDYADAKSRAGKVNALLEAGVSPDAVAEYQPTVS